VTRCVVEGLIPHPNRHETLGPTSKLGYTSSTEPPARRKRQSPEVQLSDQLRDYDEAHAKTSADVPALREWQLQQGVRVRAPIAPPTVNLVKALSNSQFALSHFQLSGQLGGLAGERQGS
jgi:hypothetical protein